MSRNKTVCVTGGAGFIGGYIVRLLLAEGWDVVVLDDFSVGRRENVPAQARVIAGDVRDLDAARSALVGVDAVIHLAARVAIRSSFDFIIEDTSVNVVGAATLLKGIAEVPSIKRVVVASSMAVYADAPLPEPIREDYPTEPLSPYGVSKLAMEKLTHACCASLGISSVALRLFNTYGLGQALSPYVGVVTIFANRMSRGEIPVVYGDGEQRRDFVHVEDVSRAFIQALQSGIAGVSLNVGTGIATSVNELIHHVNEILGKSLVAEHVSSVPGELRYSIANIDQARTLLNYTPRHRLGESLSPVVKEIVTYAKQ